MPTSPPQQLDQDASGPGRAVEYATAGVILTGGAAQLAGTAELGRDVLQMPVRISGPTGIAGLIDTIGRAFLPDLVRHFVSYSAGSSLGPSLSSMMIYMLMAAILVFRPEGLFPASNR